MSEDAFWNAVDSIEPQSTRKKKVFQSTDELLNDINSEESESVQVPSREFMRKRYNEIRNDMNANIAKRQTIELPSISTHAMINQSVLHSSSSVRHPTSSVSPSPCCENQAKNHAFTLSPQEREEIIKYKTDETIPESKRATAQKKQAFIKYCDAFRVIPVSVDGIDDIQIKRHRVQYKLKSNNKVIQEKAARKLQAGEYYTVEQFLTVPKCKELSDIFINTHAVGHVRETKMKNALKVDYWLKSVDKFVKYNLSQCETCAKVDNTISKNYTAPLQPLPIPSIPFGCLHVDLSGPYPESKQGNKYLAIGVDRLTGYTYTMVGALPSKDSEVVAWWILREIFCKFGFVNIKVTDNGGEFVNELNSELKEILQFTHRLITPYHPQANGKGESAVKNVKRSLKHCIADIRGDYKFEQNLENKESEIDDGMFDWGNDWDMSALIIAVMGVNMQPRISTGYSPLLELTGRKPIVDPSQLNIEHGNDDEFYAEKFTTITQQTVEERLQQFLDFRASMKVSLKRAQVAMKKKWDKKRGLSQQLVTGDKVVYRIARNSRSNNYKANQTWLPRQGYGVIKHISDGGLCKVDIFNAFHQLQSQKTLRIENLKKYTVKLLPAKRSREETDDQDDSVLNNQPPTII